MDLSLYSGPVIFLFQLHTIPSLSRPVSLCPSLPLQFRHEEDAEKAVVDLNNRWFNGQPIHAELSPVTDFREACCRQYEMG